MVVQLKLFELRKFPTPEARLAARDRLDERLSREFADFIGSMRGAFVKVAQVLGSLSPPPVRRPYIEKLEPMADAAPGGRAWKSVERQITRELRRGPGNRHRTISDVFSSFDPEPIGTASVGQVHRAVLRSDGRTVAVKLQYPDSKRLILTDLINIHRILKLLGKKEEAGVVNEYRSRMGMEFDYEYEGVTMNAIADFFDKSIDSTTVSGTPVPSVGRKVVVPRCLPELSTRRLLVMEYVDGGSLRDNLRGRYKAALQQPFLLRLPKLLILRQDTKHVLTTLLEAQGEQIFTLGTFNADPHPGNVVLAKDALTGRGAKLGLIDFGCSKTLSDPQRASLARLYVALARRDEEGVYRAAVEMGIRTRHMDKRVMINFVTHFFDRDMTTAMSPPAYLLSLSKIDKITGMPKDYMLVARSTLLLRGLGGKLRAPQQCGKSWEKLASDYLKRAGEEEKLSQKAIDELIRRKPP